MDQRIALRMLCVAVVSTLAAVPVAADTAPAGGGDPGALPTDVTLGPMEFNDDFDAYAAGSNMHGQGGWKGWDNSPAFGALVSNAFSHTTPNSVDISGAADLVHEFSGFTSGAWVLRAWTYIPSQSGGQAYFIALNTYSDGGVKNWSTQVCLDLGLGVMVDDPGGACGGGPSLPLVFDQWVEIRVEIDVSANSQSFYYDGALLYADSWTEHVSGSGAANIAAIDLFANNSSPVYYDDVSLCAGNNCFVPVELMSLSIDP